MRRKTFWVYYNGEYIAEYKTLKGCLDFISRKKLEDDLDNDLGIVDSDGNDYHPYTGRMYKYNPLRESKRINEWNLWDGDSRRSSSPRQTRLIDVADKMRREQMLGRKARYNNDPEYHNYIKSLEDELSRTKDPEQAEYLERRISKLRSLSEGNKTSRASRAINEMARKKKVYQVVAKCDYRDRSTEYVCDEFTSKREAMRYMKDECYDTPSRCHIIREIYKDDINEGERSSAIRNDIANKNAELLVELKFDLIDALEKYYELSGTYDVDVRYKTVNGVEVSKISTNLGDVDYDDAKVLRWRPSGSKLEPITIEEYDFYISKVEELIKRYENDGELSLVGGDSVKRLVNHYKDYRVFICKGFQYRGAKYAEDDKETKKTPVPGGYKVMTFEERINRLCEFYAAFDIRIDREDKILYINAFSSNDLY